VIGHIKVYSTAMDKHMLTKSNLEYIHEMTEIFSYGLTKIAIKGNTFNEIYTNTRIVDISISGLLFEISDENLFQYLKKHSSIKMYIPMGKHKLEINGEIIRYIVSDDGYKLGVNFFSSNPGDMKILETYIYEKKNVKIGTIKRPKGEICPSFANMLIKYGVNPIEVAHKMDDFNAMDVAFNIALNYYYKKNIKE
jgi:hypothetical protein